MRWFIAGMLALAFAGWLLFSGFADAPCQDGEWDPAKKTCVPT